MTVLIVYVKKKIEKQNLKRLYLIQLTLVYLSMKLKKIMFIYVWPNVPFGEIKMNTSLDSALSTCEKSVRIIRRSNTY